MRPIYALPALLVACAGAEPQTIEPDFDNSKADGNPARLEFVDRSRLEMTEPSDLAFVDGELYAVSDAKSKIYKVNGDGDAKEVVNVDGSDLEALAYDKKLKQFLIADEAKAKIWWLKDDGSRDASLEIDNADDGNSGIEGLVVAPNGHLFAVKEKDPSRLYEMDEDGNLINSKKLDFARDFSAVTYNTADRHLYVLSDEEHKLYRLDSNWDKDRSWKLPLDHPEGIAFDGTTLYVVSDSEARIYTFEMAQ
jgi:uncharacterized protein YjiK